MKTLQNRIAEGVKEDSITLDKQLFKQLVSMLEGMAELRYKNEDNERHIGLINKELAEIRTRLGIV